MKHIHRRHHLAVLVILVILSFSWITHSTLPHSAAQSLTPQEIVNQAWELAQTSGSYHYHSQIEQTTYPVPKLANSGRAPQEDLVTLDGSVNLPEASMEMTLWQNGGGTLADGVSIRVADGKTFARTGQAEWTEINDVADLFAPNNDPLSFVDSATQVEFQGTEDRQVGDVTLTYSRYTFELDGTAYAENMQRQMKERLQEYGALPPGIQFNTADFYRNMTGSGELWIDSDGLPQRLVIFTDIPAYRGNGRITAHITTDFSDFDRSRIATAGVSFFDQPLTWLTFRQAQLIETAQLATGYLAILATIILFVLVFIRYRHTRQLYAGFAVFMTFALVVPPMVQAEQAHAFQENLRADRLAQDARTTEAEENQSMRASLNETDWDPNVLPSEQLSVNGGQVSEAPTTDYRLRLTNNALQTTVDTSDSDNDGLLDSDEDYWGTCPYLLGTTEYNNETACSDVADPADSDADGLSDSVEVNDLGTLPTEADTDSDGITDNLEVGGFVYNSQTWYLNPIEEDSNMDGIIDGAECLVWYDAADVFDETAVCPDTDSDGAPDVFDSDNDDDGVPDAEDLSLNVGGGTTFHDDNPFLLSIDNLTVDKPVLLNLQLRPTTSNDLTLYNHVLDWPTDDTEGQITRYNDTTWAGTSNSELQSSADNAANGDIRLVPVLEITMPYSDGHYANLPIIDSAPGTRVLGDSVDTWLDSDQLDPFSITVSDIDVDAGETAAYVPLTTVTDDSDAIVAFSAQMLYRPSQANWGSDHQFRVVWLVQMITDECVDADDDPDTCTRQDVMTIIHAYDEPWQLTGLEVSEEHGLSSALIYEDPASDADLSRDDQLWTLTWNLSNTLLRGRDYYNNTTGTQGSDGLRDVTVANLDASIDDWFGGDRYVNVVQRDYDHEAYMSYFVSDEGANVLDTVFTPYADQTTPTLLYVHENESRTLNLDSMGSAITSNFSVDMDPNSVKSEVVASMSWTPYAYSGSAWDGYDTESYLDLLTYQLELDSYFQPEDSSSDAEDVADGKLIWAQLYYTALMQGLSSIIEMDAVTVWTESVELPETDYEPLVPSGTTTGAGYIATLYSLTVLKTIATKVINNSFWQTLSQTYSSSRSPYVLKTFELEIKSVKFNGLLALTIVAIAVGAALLAAGYFTGNDTLFDVGVIILNVVTIVVTIVYAINTINAMRLAAAGLSGLAAANAVLKAGRGMPALGLIGFVVGLGLTWGMFFFQMSGKSTIELHSMLAYAIAFTIILVVLFILDLLGLGLLVLLLTLVDVILTLFGETTLTERLTEWLADLLYDVNMVITNLDSSDRLDLNLADLTMTVDDLGFTQGNSLTFHFDVTNTLQYNSRYDFSRADDTVFRYYLERTENNYHDGFSLGEMSGDWVDLGDRYMQVTDSPNITIPLYSYGTGVNRSVDLYMTEAFIAQYEGCWFFDGWFGADGCTWEDIGATSNIDLGSSLVYDVLPNTIAEFARMDWNNNSTLAFPEQVDIDNDTLTDTDPYEDDVDGDGDGLTDLYELTNGLDPKAADGDGDGLNDAEELDYDTNPFLADSDGDGLNDRIEVVEGWLVPYDNGTKLARVWSDPNLADADADALNDLDEFLFGFNPWVATDPSLIQDLVKFDNLGVNEANGGELLLRFEETAVLSGPSFIFDDSSGAGHAADCDNNAGECPSNGGNGRYGYALNFDGSDDVLTVSDIDLANSSFTIAAWAQRDTTGSNSTILSQGTTTTDHGLQLGFLADNTFLCSFYGSNQTISSASYADTDWHHWACTYDAAGNQLKLYRDGSLLGSQTTNADYQGSGDLLIGQRFAATNYDFDGKIDEVAIFSRTLTSDEVGDVMNGRYNPNDLLVSPGAALTYNATVTNTTSTNATGFLVPETATIDPEVAHPTVALSFEPEQKLMYFANIAGEENSAYCIDSGTCPTTGSNGKIGAAIEFDGVDDVVHLPVMFAGDTWFNFSFWLWVDSLPASGETAMIIDTAGTEAGSTDIYLNDSGNLVFDIVGASETKVSSYSFSGNLNQWVHVSVNGSALIFNGNVGAAQSIWDLDQRMSGVGYGTLGNSIDGSSPFDGQIDELLYYDNSVEDGTGGSSWARNEISLDIMTGDYYLEALYPSDRDTYPIVLFTMEEINAFDGTIFYDSQNNSNHATCSGNACPTLTDETGGAVGRAVTFDGIDDSLTQPGSYTTPNHNTNQEGETSLTLWVNPSQYPASGSKAYIFDSTGGGDSLDMYINSDGKFVADRQEGIHTSSTAVPLNQWTEIYLRYDISYSSGNYSYDSTIDFNGVRDSSHNYNLGSTTAPWEVDLTIGPGTIGNDASGTQSFIGSLDELQLSGLATIDFDPPSANVGYENLANELRTATCDDVFVCPGDVTGQYGQGISFDGVDDTVYLGKQDFAQGDYTISAWINSSASGSSQDILAAVTPATQNHGILLEMQSDGRLHYLHRFPTGSSGGSGIVSSASYNDGNWHHVTAVYAGATMTLYVDGTSVGTATASQNATESLEVVLGRSAPDNKNDSFNGALDELLIIPAAIADDGVNLLMNSTYPVIDVPDLFTSFSAGPLSTIDVVGTAAVSEYASGSLHQFDLEAEAALELQTTIDYPVIDDNASNLVLFMPFEETPGSTSFDNLMNDILATCSGDACPTAGMRGQVDRALYFDGVDDTLAMDLGINDFNRVYSVAMWVNGKHGTLLDFDGWQIDFNQIKPAADAPIAIDLATDEWLHLVVTVQGGSVDLAKVYVNGIQVASGPATSYLPASVDFVQIGANEGAQDLFEGFIDDLRFYSSTLDDAAVLKLYEESAPVMRFEFDEDGEATVFLDNSVNGYVGVPSSQTYFEPTLQQNVTVYNPLPGTDGKIGNTALFDGNGRIEVANADAVDFANDFSIILWLKTSETGVGLIAKTDDDTTWEAGEKLFYLDNNGYPTFVGYANGFIQSATAVNDDIWHQIGVSWDATNGGKIFLDGEDITTSSSYAANNADRSGDTIKIGAPNYNEANNFFVGEMDELAVYGRAMTQPEIFSIYLREYRWYRARTTNYVEVDTDAPTIELLTPEGYRQDGYVQLAVATRDVTSRVTLLDFGIKGPGDSDFSWHGADVCAEASATNAAWCPSFDTSQLSGEGTYEVKFRAVDAVGNETTSGVYTFTTDGSAPVATTSYNDDWLTLTPDAAADLTWHVSLSGSGEEPQISGIDGSGIVTETALLIVRDATGQIAGTGMPQAVDVVDVNGRTFNWSADYTFSGARPTGRYTIALTIEDNVGNRAELDYGTIRLDGRAPSATFNHWELPNNGITQTLTLSGVAVEQPDWGSAAAAFHFEESSGATTFYDSSGEDNHATCTNCPTSVAGLFGSAADFDGVNDVLTAPAADSLNVGPGLTIAAWINPDAITGPARLLTLGSDKAILGLDDSSQLYFTVTVDGAPRTITVTNALTASEWQHLAGAYDGETMRLYWNGIELDTLAISGSVDASSGLEINNASQPFDGQMDEVMVYGRALTDAEIYAMGQSEVRGVQSVELWIEEVFFDGSTDSENWQAATLSSGTWTFDVPNSLEGFYDIHLRSSDNAGNTAVEGVIWRGSIDTEAPRITGFSGVQGGGGTAAYTEYTFNIEDIVLDIPGLIQPCAPESLSNAQYTYANNPLNGETYQTSSTCRVSGHQSGDIAITACDFVGHCSTETINLTSSPDTASVSILTPTQNSTLTLTQPISITGGAYAPIGIEDVSIRVDGAPVDSFVYGGAETDTAWATNWWPMDAGVYELTAVLTDTLNATYTDTIQVQLVGHLLFVNKDGSGSGIITSDLTGIDCGADCMATYADDEFVTLTAAPDTGSVFNWWYGDCADMGNCELTMDSTKYVTATFTLIPYDLTVTPTGDGSGDVSSDPTGISCGADCVETLDYGTVVTLTAVPAAGSVFNGWGGACSGVADCVVTISGDTNVTAEFLNDSHVGITIDSSPISLSEDGTTDVYTVTLNTNPTAPVTITFGTDAQVQPLSPIVLSDTTPQTVTVTAVNDSNAEGDHTAAITHNAGSDDPYYDGITVAGVTANIEDNDVQYDLAAETASVDELDLGTTTTLTYTITRTGDTGRSSSVNFDMLASVAELLTDFDNVQVSGTGISEAGGTITFTAGADVANITLDVLGDDIDENDEDIVLTLSSPTGTSVGGTGILVPDTVTTTIVDDDTRDVLVVGADGGLTVTEGGVTDTYTITLASEPTAPVTITIGIDNNEVDLGAGAGQPISLTYSTLNWMTPQTVTVTAVDDFSVEPTHSSVLSHTVTGGDYGTLTPANITVTITDNDTAGVVITPVSLVITETGSTSADFVMTLDSLPTAAITVTLTTDDSSECTVLPASLTLTPSIWDTGVTATVTSVDENVDDGDQLCTIVTSSAASDDADYDGLAVVDLPVTVIDDDGAPSINLAAAALSTNEAAGDLQISLNLSNPSASTVTVMVNSSENSATAGDDYTAVSQLITFDPLATSASFTLPILEDAIDEPSETLTLTLSSPANATLGLIDEMVVTIEDNDAPAQISIADSSAPETDSTGTMTFTVSLSNESGWPIMVDYTTQDGTAVAGTHYTTTTGTLTFAVGETEQTITVPIIGDEKGDPDRTFTVALSNPTNASIVDNSATGTILNDDITTIFLPMVVNNYVSAPDLVVEDLTVSGSSIVVTISNQGNAPVTDEFWVDVYINPSIPPTAVNQTIDTLNCEGAVWGVTDAALPLLPGNSLVLTLDDAYFAASNSRLSLPVAVGTAVYAQVDSANAGTTYGAVLENHERTNSTYNNILQEVAQ